MFISRLDARIQAIAEEALRAVSRGRRRRGRSEQREYPRDGFGAVLRSRILSFRASRRRIGRRCGKTKAIRSSIARSARFPPGSTFKSMTSFAGCAEQRPREHEIQLQRRGDLRRSLFPMLDQPKRAVHARHPRTRAMRSRCPATRFSTNTETRPAFDSIDVDRQDAWDSAKTGLQLTRRTNRHHAGT